MPRDLTDLMERATSYVPPEPHAAADITRLAAQRQRRRTTSIAAGVAVAVVVAGAAGYGVTRGHDTTPEPAAPYKYHQQVDISDAVPASTLPGYRLEPWTIPSVERDLGRHGPWPTYHDVDADGRMVVEDFPGGANRPPRIRLYDAPGAPAHPLRQPVPPPDYRGPKFTWVPSFVEGGRLVWQSGPSEPIQAFHVTDLGGGHDVYEAAEFNDVRLGNIFGNPGVDGRQLWGNHYWFKVDDGSLPDRQGPEWDVFRATLSGTATSVARKVAYFAAGGGRVAWVTAGGDVVTDSASSGSPRSVEVPLDPGCRVSVSELSALAPMFAVGKSAMALTESCGTGTSETHALVVFDPSGRRLARISGGFSASLSFVGDSLLFDNGERDTQVMRYELRTGNLSRLGIAGKRGLSDPQGAGDYVLWYDAQGGHVARIPQ